MFTYTTDQLSITYLYYKNITLLGEVEPIIKNDKFINIKLSWLKGKTAPSTQ
jgi:hypothetical protein